MMAVGTVLAKTKKASCRLAWVEKMIHKGGVASRKFNPHKNQIIFKTERRH